MTPTPEQVAQWAREADLVGYGEEGDNYVVIPASAFKSRLHRLVTRAMAAQAEDDAKLCEQARIETFMTESHIRQVAQARETIAAAIRANAPKV